MEKTVNALRQEFEKGGAEIIMQPLMSRYTTFKTGGPALAGVFPADKDALSRAIKLLSGTKYCVLGNGSNVIFPDGGYDGVVVFTGSMKKVTVLGDEITAECGAGLTQTAVLALRHGLSGLEFAYGIPGSIGGAVYMNAGAYDGEMAMITQKSDYLDAEGSAGSFAGKEQDFSYRHSVYTGKNLTITGCRMKLTPAPEADIKAKMEQNMALRKQKQPLEYPSAGSVFKRPAGFFAGKLISDCGLKGCRIGGAMVSEKHAGFIINAGNATSTDILKLIEHVQSQVYKAFGVALECEVRYIC